MWQLLLVVVGALAYDSNQYESYTLFRYVPTTHAQLNELDTIISMEGIYNMKRLEIGVTNEMLVSPEKHQSIHIFMDTNEVPYKIVDNYLSNDMKEEWDRMLVRGYPDKMVYDINDFNTRADIDAELNNLATKCSANVTCSVTSIGQSINGNQQNLFSMSSGAGRSGILIDSLVHPHEWLTATTLMNILDKMAKEYETDADVARLVDNYDFYFLPVKNPDGYDYTWDTDRMWRKNRRDNSNSTCYGVDLNRNYDCQWSIAGGSNDTCDERYYGTGPASEPEVENLVNFVLANPPIVTYITYHASGYYLVAPYGNCTRPPGWNDQLWPVMRDYCQALELAESGNQWDCGNSCDDLSPASGQSADWMMETGGATYSFTVGLRGTTFDPPASEIPISFNENWAGLVATVDQMIQQGLS